jgi:hypothetical protein
MISNFYSGKVVIGYIEILTVLTFFKIKTIVWSLCLEQESTALAVELKALGAELLMPPLIITVSSIFIVKAQ